MYNINNLICCLLLLSTLTSASTDLNKSVTSNVSHQILAEGGELPQNSEDKTHLSREHVVTETIEKNATTKVNDTLTPVKSLNVTQSANETIKKTDDNSKDSVKVKPVVEKPIEIDAGVSKKNDEKQSVGKKGVSFSDTDSTEIASLKETTSAMNSTNAPVVVKPKPTTNAPVPRKPLITEHDDFISNDADSKNPEPDPKISTNIDTLLEKNTKRANYVIPIVAVILSVPLVAIIISILYKRGQDWWQHRNYRRMDFLIEGMYNN